MLCQRGTPAPGEKLEVTGNLKITTGQAYVTIQTPATSASVTIDANAGNSTVWDAGTTANPTVIVNNMKAGGSYLVVVKGTGAVVTPVPPVGVVYHFKFVPPAVNAVAVAPWQ